MDSQRRCDSRLFAWASPSNLLGSRYTEDARGYAEKRAVEQALTWQSAQGLTAARAAR